MMSNSASNMQAKMMAALNGAVVDPTPFRSTDAGNALLFAAMHEADIRYVEPWRTWAVWNGLRWELVSDVMLLPLARQVTEHMFDLGGDAPRRSTRQAEEARHRDAEGTTPPRDDQSR